MLQVNVRGTFAGAREAARHMNSGGVIVNLVSTAGYRPAVGISAYVASKHAVVGLTKNLAIELAARDIRVVGVAPGVIDTPGVQRSSRRWRRPDSTLRRAWVARCSAAPVSPTALRAWWWCSRRIWRHG